MPPMSASVAESPAHPPFVELKTDNDAQADADEDAEEDGSAESEEFLRRLRMPGGGPLDPQRYIAARRHAEAMRHYSISQGRFVPNRGGMKADSLSLTQGLTGGWISVGPGNVGGRTRSLVINPQNPNIMYAGSVSGGVWKSTDAGVTWTPLTDLVPTDYISTLVMSPTDPNTIYAGTGESYSGDGRRGLGILKTTDGGATWTRLPATTNSNYYYVYKLLFTPSGNLYAATWTGVYRSSDGGNTWVRSASQVFCYELAARPDTQQDYLFANCSTTNSTAGPFNVLRNTDAAGSGTWTTVLNPANMARTSLAIAPSQPTTVYAMAWSTNPQPTNATGLIGFFRSTSSGDSGSWTMQTSNQDSNRLNTALLTNPQGLFADVCSNGTVSYGGQGGYDNVLAVDPMNPDRVWAGGVDIFRSDDGGANWGLASYWNRSGTEYAHADRHAIVFHPNYDGVNNQTLYIGTDGGLFRTDNATAAVQTGPKAECSPNKTDIVWINLNHHYAVTQYYFGRAYPGATAYFGGSQDNGTSRGSDATGPEGWNYIFGGDGGWVGIDAVDPNTIYYEYTNLSTYRSSNGGATTLDATHGISEPSANFQFMKNIAMDPADPQRLYVGGKTLWRTIDGAKSWTEASAPNSEIVSAITVSPTDPNFVMYSGATTGSIYYSHSALRTDRASAWTASKPRANAAAFALAIDPTNNQVVYATYPAFKSAATDNHVYKSTDGGQTWNGIDGTDPATSLPDIPVNAIIVDPQNTQVLYIGTDLGIYISLDGGASWSRDVSPFVNAPVTSLTLDRGSGSAWLVAFTYGRSAWKVQVADSGMPCTYSIDQSSLSLPAGGGSGTVKVQTAPGCVWSAVSFDSNTVPQSPAGGSGPGTIYYTVGTNGQAVPVKTGLSIGGTSLTINQAAADAVSTNDEVASAEPITSLPYIAAIGPDYTANASDPVHSCTGSSDLNTAWYKFTAASAGTISVRFTSSYPAVLSRYSANATGDLGSEAACFAFSTNTAGVTYPAIAVTAGQILYFEASFQSASTAARTLSIQMNSAGTAISMSVNADQATLQAGGKANLTATVMGTPNTAVRWTISPPIGKISPAGVYTAPATVPNTVNVLAAATAFADNLTQASVLLKIKGDQPETAMINAIQNAAGYQPGGPVSPGELIVIYGNGFGPGQLTPLTTVNNGALVDTATGSTRVFFDGIAAPVIYAASGQVSVAVPYEVANRFTTTMEVQTNGVYSAAFPIKVSATAPGLFMVDPGNSMQLALFNQDGTPNTPDNPAPKGSIVTCYGTGEGATTPTSTNGQINTKTLPKPLNTGTVRVGGQNATVNYLGAASGFVAGVFQLNFTVPNTATSGAVVPVTLTVGGNTSQANATMAVQ